MSSKNVASFVVSCGNVVFIDRPKLWKCICMEGDEKVKAQYKRKHRNINEII